MGGLAQIEGFFEDGGFFKDKGGFFEELSAIFEEPLLSSNNLSHFRSSKAKIENP